LEHQYLVKTYCARSCAHEWLARGGQDETIMEQFFSISGKLRAHELNIDYFPPNFVMTQRDLCYVDYEINPYTDT
jgi:TP53 regulating kinase and related kinases